MYGKSKHEENKSRKTLEIRAMENVLGADSLYTARLTIREHF